MGYFKNLAILADEESTLECFERARAEAYKSVFSLMLRRIASNLDSRDEIQQALMRADEEQRMIEMLYDRIEREESESEMLKY